MLLRTTKLAILLESLYIVLQGETLSIQCPQYDVLAVYYNSTCLYLDYQTKDQLIDAVIIEIMKSLRTHTHTHTYFDDYTKLVIFSIVSQRRTEDNSQFYAYVKNF